MTIEFLDKLEDSLRKSGIEKTDICIVGSAVLAYYDIRENKDIDVIIDPQVRRKLGISDEATKIGKNIEVVGKDWHHKISDKGIVNFKRHHFIYRGYKFVNLRLLISKKWKYPRSKDLADLGLVIDSSISNSEIRSLLFAPPPLKNYAQHYKRCMEQYDGGNKVESNYTSLYDLAIDTEFLDLDDKYYELVKRVADKASEMFDGDEGCYNNEYAIRLDKWRSLDSIKELIDFVLPQIEEKVFHSHATVEYVHAYRNRVLPPDADLKSSWMWHYDNCPNEYVKLFIHLNEANVNNGCLQYLTKDGSPPVNRTFRSRPGSHDGPRDTRISQEKVDSMLASGFRINNLVGKQGSYALMNANINHRATVPTADANPREILALFIRPCLVKREDRSDSAIGWLPEKNVKHYVLD